MNTFPTNRQSPKSIFALTINVRRVSLNYSISTRGVVLTKLFAYCFVTPRTNVRHSPRARISIALFSRYKQSNHDFVSKSIDGVFVELLNPCYLPIDTIFRTPTTAARNNNALTIRDGIYIYMVVYNFAVDFRFVHCPSSFYLIRRYIELTERGPVFASTENVKN